VFAGAVRATVFSQPEVIRRINADFVPVALKAALMGNPPNDEEGRFYREIRRSKVDNQGICVVNSSGKVLGWAQTFDDDKSIVKFLDHCLERYTVHSDAKVSVAAERYKRFPSQKLPDVEDSGQPLPIIEQHPEGKHCPAKPPLEKGTLVGQLIGRALDEQGVPVTDTLQQEHYVEARFEIPANIQMALADALADADTSRFKIPDQLARLLVSKAYLGMLDVSPLEGASVSLYVSVCVSLVSPGMSLSQRVCVCLIVSLPQCCVSIFSVCVGVSVCVFSLSQCVSLTCVSLSVLLCLSLSQCAWLTLIPYVSLSVYVCLS